jgi:hypothetical protein
MTDFKIMASVVEFVFFIIMILYLSILNVFEISTGYFHGYQ